MSRSNRKNRRARRNYAVKRPSSSRSAVKQLKIDSTLELTPEELALGTKHYKDWHWGENSSRVKDLDDDDFPHPLIECGKFIRAHVRLPDRLRERLPHPRRQRDTQIQLPVHMSENSHVAYDPHHRYRRLYVALDPRAQKILRTRFWDANSIRPMPLARVAQAAGGRHGTTDYPDVTVKPIGAMKAIVYWTHKRGDGPSYYKHDLGEISHYYPVLCCDDRGRLWIAGGNYTTPVPGITD